MAVRKKDPRLKRAGVSGFNKPKRTPNHPKKSHIVVAKEGGKVKTIRFGQQGAKTAGKPKAGESRRIKMKRKSFKARHRRNIAKGKMSAAYWANKVKMVMAKRIKRKKVGKSRVNEAGNYTKPGMRKRIFQRIKAGGKGGRPGQWSARKAQMLAKAYKAAGGGYK